MKQLFFFLFVSLLIVSCGSDDDSAEPIINADLHYDGLNQTAPVLPAGTYDLAARFTNSETNDFVGKGLEEVEFFLLNQPVSCEVRIFDGGTTSEPGTLVYSQEISNLQTNTWHQHTLTTPVEITGGDLWICIRVEHDADTQSLGCDFGPANSNGDWISSDTNTSWQSFRSFTNQEANINWNIRGQVSE